MPTYEYQCKTCGETMDVFQSIKAKPLSKVLCEKCQTVRPVKRLIGTGGAVLFKGGGFYQTDYRSEGYKAKAKADTESGSKPAGTEKAATESPSSDSTKAKPTPAPADPPAGNKGGKKKAE